MKTTVKAKKEKDTRWEKVCALHKMDAKLPDVSSFPKHMQAYQIAAYKLPFIVDYVNDGWIADYTNSNQWKYEPRFIIQADKKRKSGFGLSLDDYDLWDTCSVCGPRLVYKDWETLKRGVEEFIDVYTDFYIIPR